MIFLLGRNSIWEMNKNFHNFHLAWTEIRTTSKWNKDAIVNLVNSVSQRRYIKIGEDNQHLKDLHQFEIVAKAMNSTISMVGAFEIHKIYLKPTISICNPQNIFEIHNINLKSTISWWVAFGSDLSLLSGAGKKSILHKLKLKQKKKISRKYGKSGQDL